MNIMAAISRQWKSSTLSSEIENPTKINSAASCVCAGNEFGRFFHQFGTKLGDAKAVEEFKTQIIALILHIWIASYAQRITLCIIGAVRDCIDACKRAKFPVNPLIQFYDFRLKNKSLPTWIILHSFSDNPSKVGTRHRLLQVFLDELPPLTAAIRDELYLACATTGFNNFFSRVRMASLKELQAPSEIHTLMEIRCGLGLPSSLVETATVVPTLSGFELKWLVPDMSQRLRSGLAIGTEFVVKGICPNS